MQGCSEVHDMRNPANALHVAASGCKCREQARRSRVLGIASESAIEVSIDAKTGVY